MHLYLFGGKATMRSVMAVAISICFDVAPAAAGFVNKYSQWEKMGEVYQIFYTQGIFDQSTIFVDGVDFINANVVGLQNCSIELEFNAAQIAKQITKHYESNPQDWNLPPSAIFNDTIANGVCLKYINSARKIYRLPPIRRKN